MATACYASSGPLAIHWQAVTDARRGLPWAGFLAAVRALPAGQLWRHNQAGDLQRPDTTAGRRRLAELVVANAGRRGFTYSHWRLTAAVALAFRQATAQGFTVNASTESMAAADRAVDLGVRAVTVLPSDHPADRWRLTTPAGRPVVVCPQQRMPDRVTCGTCRLCHGRPSDVVVAFLAHGSRRAAADRIVRAAAGPAGGAA